MIFLWIYLAVIPLSLVAYGCYTAYKNCSCDMYIAVIGAVLWPLLALGFIFVGGGMACLFIGMKIGTILRKKARGSL